MPQEWERIKWESVLLLWRLQTHHQPVPTFPLEHYQRGMCPHLSPLQWVQAHLSHSSSPSTSWHNALRQWFCPLQLRLTLAQLPISLIVPSFTSWSACWSHSITHYAWKTPWKSHLGQPINMCISSLCHELIASILVRDTLKHPIILNIPWLQNHKPCISWSKWEITEWSEHCNQHCLQLSHLSLSSTSIETPDLKVPVHIPVEYHDLRDMFSKAKASGLPPHCHMTMPSTCFKAPAHHTATSTHCHLLSKRLWRNIFRKHFNRDN